MCAIKKEYTIKSDWLGNIREGLNGENMTATQILERNYIEEAVARAGRELAEEMDFSVLADLFKSTGWVEVDFNPHQRAESAHDIKEWIRTKCKGPCHSRGRRFLFQEESDAVNFVLKWSN